MDVLKREHHAERRTHLSLRMLYDNKENSSSSTVCSESPLLIKRFAGLSVVEFSELILTEAVLVGGDLQGKLVMLEILRELRGARRSV